MTAPPLYDRVYETSATTGTGPLTLQGAVHQYQSFAATVGLGGTTFYTIVHNVFNQWEIGVGTLTALSVLSRDSVLSSSSGGLPVNFTDGGLGVWVDAPAELINSLVAGTSGGTPMYYSAMNRDVVTFPQGSVLATHSSGTGVVLASAVTNNLNAVGVAALGVAPGSAESVQFGGCITLPDWSAVTGTAALSPRAVYFLDDSVSGGLTTVPPTRAGEVIQVVGRAVGANSLELEISQSIML